MTLSVGLFVVAALTAGTDGTTPGRDLFGTRGGTSREAKGRSSNVWGELHLSNGDVHAGWLSLSYGRQLELYDLARKTWRKIHLSQLKRMDASIRSEEFEREWRWQEGGSDVKVYTGRGYPRRWLDHTVQLSKDERFVGHLNGAVIHIKLPPKPKDDTTKKPGAKKVKQTKKPVAKPRYILRQYERGKLGTTLDDLVYVKAIVIASPPSKVDPGAAKR